MKRERRNHSFIKKPVYPGGPTALRTFVVSNLTYPEAARAARVEGTVHLRYTIDYTGKVVGSKVISGIGYGCDEEAQRLVGLLRFEVPKNRGVRVQFHKTLRVHFRLPKEPEPPAVQVQYTYTTPSAAKPDAGAARSGYEYTITWGS